MPRDRRRMEYMRDRVERRGRRGGRDRGYYPMSDYDYASDRARGRSSSRGGSRRDERDYMDYDYDRRDYGDYDYDSRGDYRDYARRGIGRPREYDRRDYADDELDEDYEEDLKKWIEKLKKKDRFGLSKDQVIQKAKEMRVKFDDYDENEFYAVYLMQVSDYPTISNDSRMYLNMAKSWLEDDDIAVSPSEKLCKYMYEIVMADED